MNYTLVRIMATFELLVKAFLYCTEGFDLKVSFYTRRFFLNSPSPFDKDMVSTFHVINLLLSKPEISKQYCN